MRYAIFLSVICATAIAHAAEPTPASNPPTILDPVFDCYRANSAWGFALSGKMIDRNSRIWSYGKHGQVWQPALVKQDGAVYLSAEQLRGKFVEAKESGSVDAKALQDNSDLIAKAGKGTLTQTDSGVRDAGTSTCHAYVHDEAKQRYRDIDLGSDGGVSNVRVTNSAAEAQTLLIWLKFISVAN